MSNLTLAKTDLPNDYIQAAIGEPYIVRDNLFQHFLIEDLSPDIAPDYFEYTKPEGYGSLVKFLEQKYNAPVIITNGAKQACGALFYALKKTTTRTGVYMKIPYWSLFPPLLKMHNLDLCHDLYNQNVAGHLLVSPNNPDNYIFDDQMWFENQERCKELDIQIIHDAVYYNHIYMSPDTNLKPIGDIQVFTCSKLLGLSQLRVGFAVFHNTKLYNKVLDYMESMTVGVSILSQMFAYNILKEMQDHPEETKDFEEYCRDDLEYNRKLVQQINPSILEIDKSQNSGMFLWAKCHDLNAFKQSKIVVADGVNFGAPGYIRLNLGLESSIIQQIVERLNNV